jgi:hypothetical protein
MVDLSRGADHLGATLARKLNSADPDRSSRAIYEHGLSLADTEQVKRARGGLDCGWQRYGGGEVQRGRAARRGSAPHPSACR